MKLSEIIKNSIIILDEAHNINSICEDIAGFSLSSLQISQSVDRVTAVLSCLDKIKSGGGIPYEWECVCDEDSKVRWHM